MRIIISLTYGGGPSPTALAGADGKGGGQQATIEDCPFSGNGC